MKENAELAVPRPVVALSAAVWGLVSDEVALGLVLAALLQLPAALRWRFDLEARHYHRAADLTSIGFALFTLYEFNARGLLGIYGILAGLPLCVAPLVLLASYSERQAIPASALALSIRRRVRAGAADEVWLDLGPAFVALSLLAMSGGKMPAYWFDLLAFTGLLALLFPARPRRAGAAGWMLAAACAGALGLGTASALDRLHASLEDALQNWFSAHWYTPEFDRATTSIGRLGRLKLSNVVRLRIHTESPLAGPLLIQEASFQTFRFGTWSTGARHFESIDPEPGGQAWRLGPAGAGHGDTIDIDLPQAREFAILPLPLGAQRLTSGQIIEIRRNALGTLQAEAAPGQLRYRVELGAQETGADLPQPADLALPEAYVPVLRDVAREIALPASAPLPAVAKIQAFFRQNFRYSLVQRGFFPGRMPLTDFLLRQRHGHCEYFASATVLLLRYAGIPARYAVGYGVDEYSRLEQAYIARSRHAHAWAMAYLDGRWLPIDTTPSLWFELEADQASPTQFLSDLWSWAGYRLGRLRFAVQAAEARTLLGAAFALAVVLVWRLRGQIRRLGAGPTVPAPRLAGGELQPLFAALAARGLPPLPGETIAAWLGRLRPGGLEQPQLRRLITLYYRRRFRAGTLGTGEREELTDLGRRYVRAIAPAQ